MTNVTDWRFSPWPWDAITAKLKAHERGNADMLYVPWWRRREDWRHDHNTGGERNWQPEKIAVVGKLIRVGDGRIEARCWCGTLFVADAGRHVVYPPVAALGII